MVCVDRIIASAACFQEPSLPGGAAATVSGVERENEAQDSVEVRVVGENGGGDVAEDVGFGGEGCSFTAVKSKGSFRECRICQEEDEEKDMEAPCACNGTLKVSFLPPSVCLCVCKYFCVFFFFSYEIICSSCVFVF